jgi:hypothetical protein
MLVCIAWAIWPEANESGARKRAGSDDPVGPREVVIGIGIDGPIWLSIPRTATLLARPRPRQRPPRALRAFRWGCVGQTTAVVSAYAVRIKPAHRELAFVTLDSRAASTRMGPLPAVLEAAASTGMTIAAQPVLWIDAAVGAKARFWTRLGIAAAREAPRASTSARLATKAAARGRCGRRRSAIRARAARLREFLRRGRSARARIREAR